MRQALRRGQPITVYNQTRHETYMAAQTLTDRQVATLLAGGLLKLLREQYTTSWDNRLC